ncbi:MAG: hypothetical protein ABI878_05510 [Acidobacteriota bacterium]
MSKVTVKRPGFDHFSNHNWDRWSTPDRLAWMLNFRNRLSVNNGACIGKYGLTREDIEPLRLFTEALERLDLQERAKKN